MTCYTVPLVAAIVYYVMRRNITGWKENKYHSWLNLLLVGGAIFGVADHLWHGEIFLIGDNLILDLILGVVITTVIILIWEVIMIMDRKASLEISK